MPSASSGRRSSPIPTRRSAPGAEGTFRAAARPAAGRRAGRLHPRHQGVPRARVRRRRPGADPATRDRAAGRPGRSTEIMRRLTSTGVRPPGAELRVLDVGTGSGASRSRSPPTCADARVHPTRSCVLAVGHLARRAGPRARERRRARRRGPGPVRRAADLLPPGEDRGLGDRRRQPAVRPRRRDGVAAGRHVVRAGAGARRRAGRARGHRPAAGPAAAAPRRRRDRAASRSAPTRARRSSSSSRTRLPGWACRVEPDLAGLPRVAVVERGPG